MTRIAVFIILQQTAFSAWSQTLEVNVTSVRDARGTVRIGLYSNEDSFTDNPWRGATARATAGTVRVIFENVPPGKYAVSVIHDANENAKLDKNFLGIPREGFGFSNNAMGTFGPPGFEEASFQWKGEGVIEVRLKYLTN